MDDSIPSDLNRLAEQLLDLAAKAGAEATEIFQSASVATPVSFEANRLKQIEQVQTDGTALRLWRDGRPGLVVAHGAIDPQRLVERAIALSALNQPEAIELTQGNTLRYPDLGQPQPLTQLIDWGKETIELVLEDFPDLQCTGEWECDTETTRLINSGGLDIYYSDTTLNGYLLAEWIRGEDFLAIADGQTQRDTLEPRQVAEQVKQRLIWSQQNVPSPKGRIPILLTSKAADILWGTVQAALNGKQVLEGASPWGARREQAVTSPLLTVLQAPQIGPFSCPFDDEGTPTQKQIFLQGGVLQNFYCDRATARQLGIPMSGNGFRPSLGSYPTPSLYNLLIEDGPATPESLIANLEDGLIVDQILGSSAGITGDLSVNVDLGFRVQHGQILGRVKDCMVTGNVYAALKQMMAVANDGAWNGYCYTPSVMVDALSITSREV